MKDIYNVPIIHPDMSVETTILHIANALDYLTNTVNDIFNKIDNRIEENCKRTTALKERIDNANEKINRLVGSKKATIVYSSAKYPAGNIHKYPETTFKGDESLRFVHNETIVTKQMHYDEKLLNERLHFFHVKSKEAKIAEKKIPEEGLGFIPNNINSVTSMLLYNTKENPYKQYLSLDPLNSSNNLKQSVSDKAGDHNADMEDAPISISNRFNTVKNYSDAFIYSPNIGEVPQIDVPIDLPDLPGIADDISYDFIDSGAAIAPSLLSSPSSNILDLPDLTDIKNTSDDMKTVQSLTEIHKSKFSDIPEEKIETEVSNEIVKHEQTNSKAQIEEKVFESKESTVYIPPPPPPMIAPPPPLPPNIEESLKKPPKSMPNTDNRASLMAAIRQAGGVGKAKLRAAKPLHDDEKEKSLPKSSSVGAGNLMADLHAKLSMRRKGISGSKSDSVIQNNDRGDGSVMDKISAMIPPPPKLDRNTESENDTDWE